MNSIKWPTAPRKFPLSPVHACVGVALCCSGTLQAAETKLGGFGQTQLQQDTGDAVQFTCGGFVAAGTPPGTVPLFDTCRAMVHTANDLSGSGPSGDSLGLTSDELAASLQQIATEEFAATKSMATEMNVTQSGNVLARLVELRRSSRGFRIAGLSEPDSMDTLAWTDAGYSLLNRGGGGSSDGAGGRWGGFLNGSYGTGDRDETDRTNQFDFDSYSLTGGIDYRFTDNLVIGAALSYYDVESKFDDKPTVSGGNVDADGWGGFVYGSWYSDRLYVDGMAGYASSDYDSRRRIIIPDNNNPAATIDETAKGSPDSDDYSFSLGAGYTLGDGALTYGPYGRLNYYEVDIDDYTESGAEASGLNLAVDGQDWKSLTTVLGGQIAYAMSQSFGVLVPQAQAGWVHEFENDEQTFTAVYVTDPRQNVLAARTNDPDRDYFELGLGVSAVFKGGVQAFVYYDTVLGLDDVTDHIFTVGGRMEF